MPFKEGEKFEAAFCVGAGDILVREGVGFRARVARAGVAGPGRGRRVRGAEDTGSCKKELNGETI